MYRLIAALPFVLFAGSVSWACPVGHAGPARSRKPIIVHSKRKPSSALALPTAQSSEPWGGSEASKWKPEAILANAASRALNEAWALPNVDDVYVSIPVKMKPTKERPYGDGQTNASLTFGWAEREPQLVMTLIIRGGTREVHFLVSPKIEVSSLRVGSTTVALTKGVGVWTIPANVTFGNIDHPQVMWVKLGNWTTSFPMDFRFPLYKTADLAKAASAARTAGGPALDPMGIRDLSKGKIVQDVLMQTRFGSEWVKNDHGGDWIAIDSVHATTPDGRTAVGGGNTWVINKGPASTFKNLYTCFEKRGFKAEGDNGVPSGGGWHEIGDPAETIINAVEEDSVLVGQATGVPFPAPDAFSYDLSDVATMHMLRPGEALMTGAGDVTWNEDRPAREGPRWPGGAINWDLAKRGADTSGAGRNYHWFAFASDEPTCTEEWVHNCRPTSANLGLDSACK